VDRNGLHVIVPILAFIGWARSMAFLGDNGTFALLATIAAGDPLRRRLTTEAGFRRFHSAVPVIRPWLAAGEPISPIRVMARLENSYRRLADGDGPVAGGMVLLGDSCLHTNPTAGRGVSLAFAQAEHLALTIGGATDPPVRNWRPSNGARISGSYLARVVAR
jgi:2-polyprenyl-6-methoxyphenol hydroxylase-like FAD-dependent oxidoreductase